MPPEVNFYKELRNIKRNLRDYKGSHKQQCKRLFASCAIIGKDKSTDKQHIYNLKVQLDKVGKICTELKHPKKNSKKLRTIADDLKVKLQYEIIHSKYQYAKKLRENLSCESVLESARKKEIKIKKIEDNKVKKEYLTDQTSKMQRSTSLTELYEYKRIIDGRLTGIKASPNKHSLLNKRITDLEEEQRLLQGTPVEDIEKDEISPAEIRKELHAKNSGWTLMRNRAVEEAYDNETDEINASLKCHDSIATNYLGRIEETIQAEEKLKRYSEQLPRQQILDSNLAKSQQELKLSMGAFQEKWGQKIIEATERHQEKMKRKLETLTASEATDTISAARLCILLRNIHRDYKKKENRLPRKSKMREYFPAKLNELFIFLTKSYKVAETSEQDKLSAIAHDLVFVTRCTYEEKTALGIRSNDVRKYVQVLPRFLLPLDHLLGNKQGDEDIKIEEQGRAWALEQAESLLQNNQRETAKVGGEKKSRRVK